MQYLERFDLASADAEDGYVLSATYAYGNVIHRGYYHRFIVRFVGKGQILGFYKNI